MTTHKIDGRTVELKREAVQKYYDMARADAARDRDRSPTRGEYELGMTSADLYKYSQARGREADRLAKILQCIDAGVAELPAELYGSSR